MSRFLTLAILAVLIGLAAAALWQHRVRPAPDGLTLVGGRHHALPQLDTGAPGAEEIRRALDPSAWERAEAQARRAVREHPAAAGARYNLGVVLHWRGRPAEALREYRRALREAPAHEQARDAVALAEALLRDSATGDRR